ncbi:hypothetical protein [Streptomyces sp. NPDC014733]|uniref:hypothetical protein n=1 Tax=Streptomyces sp. NPDC014733 TaxID=3364885 RepID=UPI00370001C2
MVLMGYNGDPLPFPGRDEPTKSDGTVDLEQLALQGIDKATAALAAEKLKDSDQT